MSNQHFPECTAISRKRKPFSDRRRTFLASCVRFAFLLAGTDLLAGVGCGGGGSSSSTSSSDSTVFAKTETISISGGKIADPTTKVSFIVPPGCCTAPTSVSLRIGSSQSSDAAAPGFTLNPNSIELTIDTSNLGSSGSVQVEIPYSGTYDQLRSMIFAANSLGTVVPVTVSYDASRSMLVGSLPADALNALAAQSSSAVAKNTGSTHENTAFASFNVFSATAEVRALGANGALFGFDGSTFTAPASLNLASGKRIALLVHGILEGRADMIYLAQFLKSILIPDTNLPLYDEIWCFGYEWRAHIKDSGKILASTLNTVPTDVANIDLIAHSMGGLVSRWALEQEGLGSRIKRLITLGTPHEGCPFQAIQFLCYLLAKKTNIDISSIIPGVDDLCAKQFENPLAPSFLKTLNDGLLSPFHGSAEYFTLAGTNIDLIEDGVDIGRNINDYYYNAGDLSDPIKHDGIVPVYSANSTVLSIKSDVWQTSSAHKDEVLLNHDQLRGVSDSNQWASARPILSEWALTGILGVVVQ